MTQMTANSAGSAYVFVKIWLFSGNPVKYTDPDGRAGKKEETTKNTKAEARDWINNNVIKSGLNMPVVKEMYAKGLRNDATPYIQGKFSVIAKEMSSDTSAYVNQRIKQRLSEGVISGQGGTTSWTNTDLQFSIGSSGFSWQLDSYDSENQTATVTVNITDIFDFNRNDTGVRSPLAERLTKIGREAEMSTYDVNVTYELKIKVIILNNEEK
jgi:hypothetical protein